MVSTSAADRIIFVFSMASGLLLTLLIRTAWQADDAFAAWRLVDNFVNGYGLRYNLDERVQTFTAMLWTFVNAGLYAITRNIYYTSIFLSIAMTLVTAWVIAWPYRTNLLAVVFTYVTLMLSLSFMDFSAAGFENPLSHLLLALFAYVFFFRDINDRATFRTLFLIAALAGLNRLDTLAYYIFPLAVSMLTTTLPRRDKIVGALCILVPLALWHGFALFYFGFPFQNAAYAKRFNNVPTVQFLRAGADYYLNSISRDPITLTVICSSLIVGFRMPDLKTRAFASGILFYLLYVFYIGGDFMSGRFFSLALVAGVILILRTRCIEDTTTAFVSIPVLIALGCLAVQPSFLTKKSFGAARERSVSSEWEQRGIADERASWYEQSGLLLSSRFYDMPRPVPAWPFDEAIKEFVKKNTDLQGRCVGNMLPTGYFGYFAPRSCHVYDTNGQVDPLMARLPFQRTREWKQGHLFKPEVPGYAETLRTGTNQIADPDLAAYYEKLQLITRGDLWSWERLITIAKMNLGFYDHHVRAYADRQAKAASPL